MPQKLSPAARKAKKARDLAYAKTPRRRKMKAENQKSAVLQLRKVVALQDLIMTITLKGLYL